MLKLNRIALWLAMSRFSSNRAVRRRARPLAALERMRTQPRLNSKRVAWISTARFRTRPHHCSRWSAPLEQALSEKVSVDNELREARESLEAAEAALRGLDEQRVGCETSVDEMRSAMEQARLAAQEIRVRSRVARRAVRLQPASTCRPCWAG